MIWRLTYCNKDGVEARLDIIRGASTPVEVVEGTATPFVLNYKMDKPDKSGFFMTSSADISIFETPTFNIDNLKTSSETEIKVEYRVNGNLEWAGFALPDFFSRQVGEPVVVEMTASDRLGALKGVTLSDLPARVSLRSLLTQCLSNTGLSLPLNATVGFTHGTTNILDTEVLSQRLTDSKGRSISCYDIVESILVLTNSTLRQANGEWRLINKIQHEAQAATIAFGEVHAGARRTIVPVASSVGVFHEHGGGLVYPTNYNFVNGLANWTAVNGFSMFAENRNVIRYNSSGTPIYGESGFHSMRQVNEYTPYVVDILNQKHVRSDAIPVKTNDTSAVNVNIDLNITGRNSAVNWVGVTVLAEKSGERLALDQNGTFRTYKHNISNPGEFLHLVALAEEGKSSTSAATKSKSFSGLLKKDDVSDYTITILISGSTLGEAIFINSASIAFTEADNLPKGNLFKTEQGGASYTKVNEIKTSIFGDYLTGGLNGYFYNYMPDDTSSLHLPNGTLTSLWTFSGYTGSYPVLQLVTRQQSELFSVAHDILRATIDVATFNPMAVYQDCAGGKYVIVSASYDFLRSTVNVELEQIAYGSLEKRDYIYSYFGEGESGISSVGGISGGGTGTGGGGMTAEQLELLNTVAGYWTLDVNGNLKTTYNAYSEQELSAFGFGGSGGGGGGGAIATVYGYSNLGGTFSNSDLNNTFNAYTINQLHLRITTLENNGGGGGSTEWNNILNKPSWIGATKPSYSWSEITGLQTQLNAKALNTININAGTGLSGGGNLTANRTISLSATTIGQIAEGVQAKQDIDNLEIGGRNLILNSNVALDISTPTATYLLITWQLNTDGISLDDDIILTVTITVFEGFTASIWFNRLDPNPLHYHTNKDETITVSHKLKARQSLVGATTTPLYNVGYGSSNEQRLSNKFIIHRAKLEKGAKATDWTPAPEDIQNQIDLKANIASPVFTGIVTAPTFSGALSGNAASATLATNLNRSVVAGSGMTGGGTLNGQNITLTLGTPSTLSASSSNGVTASSHTHAITTTSTGAANTIVQTNASGGTTFTGTVTAPTFSGALSGNATSATKLQTARTIWGQSFNGESNVSGTLTGVTNITASGQITAPKVIFSAAGWAMVQTGTELQMQYNGVVKQRYLNDGSIAAIGELTAYAAVTTGGSSDFLSKTDGGTVVGAVTFAGAVTLPTLPALTVTNLNATNLVASTNVTTPKVTLGNGWTIEQNATTLTIRKGGVIKYTVNA